MYARVLFALIFQISPALAAAPQVPVTIPVQIKPADEGSHDPSFSAYRKKLMEAVARKDVNAVVKLMDPRIKLDFGEGEGIATFKKNWKVANSGTHVWKALAIVVGNGGHFNNSRKTEFAAPYVYSAWPDDFDAFENVAITDPKAELLEGPHESRRVIRKLGFEVVEVIQGAGKPQHETGGADWSEIKTQDGKRGYVRASQYRSPIDYRAIFEKRKGKWRMTVFIAGD